MGKVPEGVTHPARFNEVACFEGVLLAYSLQSRTPA